MLLAATASNGHLLLTLEPKSVTVVAMEQ